MTDQRLRLASAWLFTRVDELETFEITTGTPADDRVIALVPMGQSKVETAQQRAVLALICAAPVMRSAVDVVLSELLDDKPDIERCRSVLLDAAAAARGS